MDASDTAQEILQKIANTSDLQTAIARLERTRTAQEDDLKVRYNEMLVSLRPKNILKNTLREVQESPTLKGNLFRVALGLGAGYLSRKVVVRESAGVLKKALGTALQYGVTNLIAARDPNGHSTDGKIGSFFRKLVRRRQKKS